MHYYWQPHHTSFRPIICTDFFSPSSISFPNGSSPAVQQNISSISPVIHKNLMGYISITNLPNQVYRKHICKDSQFTTMSVGRESGLGKSMLIM
ncbi:hypothetical protein HD554DRAFT_2018531 [Boletus coccyginus]|nr:hypothetical protein HD554DRAFT_2018531 [Boletus coccyginus]